MSGDIDEIFREYFRRIQRAIRRIEEEIEKELSTLKPMWDHERECLEPLYDIIDEGDEIKVTFDLPYIKRDTLSVNIGEHEIVVEAELKEEMRYTSYNVGKRREICFRRFYKRLILPEDVEPKGAKVTYKRGFLIITVPKKRKGYRIEVE